MAKFPTYHVWVEYEEKGVLRPFGAMKQYQLVIIDSAPNKEQAAKDAAQYVSINDANKIDHIPLSAYVYEIGYNPFKAIFNFKPKVVYDIVAESEDSDLNQRTPPATSAAAFNPGTLGIMVNKKE